MTYLNNSLLRIIASTTFQICHVMRCFFERVMKTSHVKSWILSFGCFLFGAALFGWLIPCWKSVGMPSVVSTTSLFGLSHPISEGPSVISPEMKEFSGNRALLTLSSSQPRNQPDDALLRRQVQLSQIVAAQQAHQALPIPPPLQVPPGASPQLKALLSTRDRIMRSQIQVMNQYCTADPKVRSAAMRQWDEQNADLIKTMRQEAEALAKTN